MLRLIRATMFIVPVLLLASPEAASQANLSFDDGYVVEGRLRPSGWSASGAVHDLALDTLIPFDGVASLRSRYSGEGARPMEEFAVAAQIFPLEGVRGRALRLSGWLRTEDVAEGYAGFWMRVDGPGQQVIEFENMSGRAVRGTTPWTRYTIELPVDSGAIAVVFGVLHPGTGTAWFDSLALEVVGPPRPRGVASTPPFVPPPRPPEDPNRLLTDDELALVPDPAAPPERPEWGAWIRDNARPIRSLTSSDFSDLEFLRPLVEGRRIVQLGESGHGVREFNLAKVRLIRFLHERLGYDVIAFESSLIQCDQAGRAAAAAVDAISLMRSCIFGVWHTAELVPLFEYILETQRTDRPLRLVGFDTQASSDDRASRSDFLSKVVAALDTAFAREVWLFDRAFDERQLSGTGAVTAGTLPAVYGDSIVAFYDRLAEWLERNQQALVETFIDEPTAPALAHRAAVSMAFFARQLLAGRGDDGVAIRDLGMADNLEFIADVLYPEAGIVVWAHNAHIQHRGYGGGTPRDGRPRMMGSLLAERRREDLYTVGLYMYRGSAAANNREVYPLTPNRTGSLESIFHRSPWRYTFVDLSNAERGTGTSWMDQAIPSKEWGTYSVQIVPRDEYDAILFVDTTWPPDYLPGR